jgi:hypothetical protein
VCERRGESERREREENEEKGEGEERVRDIILARAHLLSRMLFNFFGNLSSFEIFRIWTIFLNFSL